MATLILFLTLAAALVAIVSICFTAYNMRIFHRREWVTLRVFDALYHPYAITAYLWLIARWLA